MGSDQVPLPLWIPASAGMTLAGLDSRLRGNDGARVGMTVPERE